MLSVKHEKIKNYNSLYFADIIHFNKSAQKIFGLQQEKKTNGTVKTESPKSTIATIGEPLAPGMMQLLRDEIVNGFQRRGNAHRFAQFQS